MKTFEPSPDFVNKVMSHVLQVECRREMQSKNNIVSLVRIFIQYAVSAGMILFGVFNVLRLYMTVFAPVLCR